MFNLKDTIPNSLKLFVIYNCVCPGCNACQIGEITCHLSTRIKEHLETYEKSHIFAHLANNETWKALSTEKCFEIIDSASTPFSLKLKNTMHIIWKKPSVNNLQKHVSIFITVQSSFIFNYYFHFTLSFHFSPSPALSFRTFHLVSRCILNSICNHSNFVNYYFMITFLSDNFIKICKEQFYVML